jgi:hypothetical protein
MYSAFEEMAEAFWERKWALLFVVLASILEIYEFHLSAFSCIVFGFIANDLRRERNQVLLEQKREAEELEAKRKRDQGIQEKQEIDNWQREIRNNFEEDLTKELKQILSDPVETPFVDEDCQAFQSDIDDETQTKK